LAEVEAKPRSRRAPEVLVTLIGLLYAGLYLLFFVIVPNLGVGFVLMLIPFTALFLILAFGVWKVNRFAFAGSAVLTAVFLILEGFFALEALGNPSDSTRFVGVVTVFFSLVATFVYSVLGTVKFWRKGAMAAPPRTILRSSIFALFMLGFIVGALVIGALAGPTEARLLGNLGKTADIVIVQGAATQGNPAGYYAPATFTAKVGQSVVWSNGDGTIHTVTTDTSKLFDSGGVPSGGTFSYKFTQAGTYTYYCTIHPFMKGTVVVTP